MGRSKHCSINGRWSILVINTSHDASRRPLGVPYSKWHNSDVHPKLTKITVQCIYYENMLIWQMRRNISVTMRDRGLQWRHVTPKGQGHDTQMFDAWYLWNRARFCVNGPAVRVLWSNVTLSRDPNDQGHDRQCLTHIPYAPRNSRN